MRIPIRIKFSLLIFLLILIITGVIFWFTLNRVRNSLIQEIKLQGEILANVITVKNEGVGYAYIVDNDKIIRAHNKIELVGKTAEEFKPPPYLYNVTLPILLAGKKEIGKVSVGLETERIENTTYAMQVVLILISVSGLLIGILGAMLLSNYLTNPIQDLVEGVKSIAKGDFDQRIEKKSNDEIGDLTEAFNEMTKSLKEKEQIKDAFRRYVSHQVAEEIFKNFADIRGFTPLAERLPAEEVVSLLNDVLTSMTNSIFRYEGTIDKFLGDGLMAVFGAPIVHKNDTDLAIHAAVDVQKSINLMNEERAKQNKDLIKVGIGVHTGEVVVGNIGTKERLDYTVIGDSVNLASRLQGVAGGGEIIISEHAFQEASVPYKFSEPMLIKVKGKAEPIKIYQVLY